MKFWQEFTVPWAPDERVERIKSMTGQELQQLGGFGVSFGNGVFARTNGSPYAVAKIPDLQNLKDSRYMDATGSHRLRGPEDVARYAALVTGADRMDYGPHRILTDAQRGVRFRYADEVLYSIGVLLLSSNRRRIPNWGRKRRLILAHRSFSEGWPRVIGRRRHDRASDASRGLRRGHTPQSRGYLERVCRHRY